MTRSVPDAGLPPVSKTSPRVYALEKVSRKCRQPGNPASSSRTSKRETTVYMSIAPKCRTRCRAFWASEGSLSGLRAEVRVTRNRGLGDGSVTCARDIARTGDASGPGKLTGDKGTEGPLLAGRSLPPRGCVEATVRAGARARAGERSQWQAGGGTGRTAARHGALPTPASVGKCKGVSYRFWVRHHLGPEEWNPAANVERGECGIPQ